MQQNKILFFIIIISLCYYTTTQTNEFSSLWQSMQKTYSNLKRETLKYQHIEKSYVHPFWNDMKNNFTKLITLLPNKNFVFSPPIGTIVITEPPPEKHYLTTYLGDDQHCLSDESKALLQKFKDESFTGLPKNIKELNCSGYTLRQLYLATKAIEHCQNKKITSLLEFGGGIGLLAYVFRSFFKDMTIYIVDLPETIAFQYLFLKGSLPDVNIIVHTEVPDHFANSTIHLIPVCLLPKLNVTVDLFTSNFGLSETVDTVADEIINKNFFNAKTCYITAAWFSHRSRDKIAQAIKNLYEQTLMHPFLHPTVKTFEYIGWNHR